MNRDEKVCQDRVQAQKHSSSEQYKELHQDYKPSEGQGRTGNGRHRFVIRSLNNRHNVVKRVEVKGGDMNHPVLNV